MRLIDRYILTEWVKTFSLALGATLGVLLLQNIQHQLDDFFSWGATTSQIFRYYAYLLPTFLPALLPISMLVATLFMLGNLHRNNEIVAMRASGMHLFTITRTLWMMGILFSFLMFYLIAHLVPLAVQESNMISDNIKMAHSAEKQVAREVGTDYDMGFDNRKDHRLWFLNSFSRYTNDGYGVTVYQFDPSGKEIQRIMGKEAYFDDVDGYWIFTKGRIMYFEPDTGDPIRSSYFEKQVFPSLTESPSLMLAMHKNPDDLSFIQLGHMLDKISPKENPKMYSYEVQYQSILASPLNCLVVIAIAIPFAVAGVRTNPLVGVSKAAGLFFCYYLVASISHLLGAQQVIPVFLAAWGPLILILLYTIYLFRKVE